MEEKYGFRVYDMVVMNGIDPHGCVPTGSVGIVCHIVGTPYSYNCDIGVEWEQRPIAGHDCNGYSKNPYGRYVPHTTIAHADVDFGEINTGSAEELFGLFL